MTDWVVWPIFVIQLIAFLLIWVPNQFITLRLRFKHIAFLLLFMTCLLIVASIYHDSDIPLMLHF